MKAGRYKNLGWFARHPKWYELGLVLLATLRREAARSVGTHNRKVLDIACGTGGLSYELVKLQHEVTGIDLDGDMLKQAARKTDPNLDLCFVHGDAIKLPFADHSYDAATMAFAMHDVPYEIGVLILRESRRVLAPQGEITIIDYNEPKKNLLAGVLFLVASLYESPNYSLFVKRGLDEYLQAADMVVRRRFTIFGAVQVVTCG